MLVSCLTYSSTVKMEATCYSETSVEFQRTTRPYVPEDRNVGEIIVSHILSLKQYSSMKSFVLVNPIHIRVHMYKCIVSFINKLFNF
jgi:hypothetical protein